MYFSFLGVDGGAIASSAMIVNRVQPCLAVEKFYNTTKFWSANLNRFFKIWFWVFFSEKCDFIVVCREKQDKRLVTCVNKVYHSYIKILYSELEYISVTR